MEKIVLEKQQMDLFREELSKREELVKKKELLLLEKNELEVKKLRTSQKNLESLAQLDHKIANAGSGSHRDLEETHTQLMKQRRLLDDKLSKGDVLSMAEERRLIEIGEAIEALEVAIDYETESIKEHEQKIRDSIVFTTTDSAQVRTEV